MQKTYQYIDKKFNATLKVFICIEQFNKENFNSICLKFWKSSRSGINLLEGSQII